MKATDIRSKIFVMTLTLGVAGFISPVRADTSTPPGAIQGGPGSDAHGACKEDVQKYCNEVQPGQGRIVGCLKQHQSELSQGCQTRMAEVKEKVQKEIQDFKQACQADLAQYCKEVQPGERRLLHCLQDHQSQLSSPCQQAMTSMHPKRPNAPKGTTASPAPIPTTPPPTGTNPAGDAGATK